MGLFSKLFGKPKQPTPQPQVNVKPETGKSHTKVCKVAGVTFNGRQKILKKLKADKSAGKTLNVSMQEYDYQGNPAIRILVNGMDVGNLHTEDVTFVKENQKRILGIKDFTIGEHYDEHENKDGDTTYTVQYNAKVKLIVANKN